jgi:tRNA (mo5U34)-methyltransferase
VTLQSTGLASGGRGPVARRIAELAPWFHNLHLRDGHETAPDHPLGDFPAFKWRQIAPSLPGDLTGARALDIGCNAGFYAFELAARGAEVLAIDLDEHYLRQARWAAGSLDPHGRVRFERMQVYELDVLAERFDVILFLGVLYHLRYPLLALDLVAERLAGTLVVQTLTMPDGGVADPPDDLAISERERMRDPSWPKAAFVERSLAGDPTNWWAPDDGCVRAMLRSCGLLVVGTPADETYVCERTHEAGHVRDARLAEMHSAVRRGA